LNTIIEQRMAPRYQKDTSVFVELSSGSVGDKVESCIVICRSVDLSNTGVQVLLDKAIPEGYVLRLCLDTRGREPIFVVGKVVWQLQDEDSEEHFVGFRRLDSEGTDFLEWRRAISEMFENEASGK